MSAKDNFTPRSPSRWVVAAWLALLVAAGGLACAKGVVVFNFARQQAAETAAQNRHSAIGEQIRYQLQLLEGKSERALRSFAAPRMKIEPAPYSIYSFVFHSWYGYGITKPRRAATTGLATPSPDHILQVNDAQTTDNFYVLISDDKVCYVEWEHHYLASQLTAAKAFAVMLDYAAILIAPGCLGLYFLFWVRARGGPKLRRTYARLMLGVAFLAMLGGQISDSEHARHLFNTDKRHLRFEAILFLCMAIPILYLLLRKGRRMDAPECASCGYDLTGNRSGTCPECGAHVPYAICHRPDPRLIPVHPLE